MDTANHYSSHTDYTFAALADAFNHATLRQQREMGTALLRIFEPLSYHHGTATVADRPMKLHFAMQAPVFMDLFTQGKLHLLQPDTVTRAFVDVTYDRHTAEPVAFQAQVFDFLSVNPNIPNPDQALFQTSFLVFDGEDEDYPFGKCDYTSRPVVKSPKEIQTHLDTLADMYPSAVPLFAHMYRPAARRFKKPIYVQGKHLGAN